MKRLFQASLLLLVLLAGSTPLLEHHGNASYENKEVTIKGKVTQWLWTNPHSFLMVDVTDVTGVSVEDEFVLIGAQEGSEIVTNELARVRTTIPWEIVTGMAYRLPRVYHADSVLKGLRTLAGEARVGSRAG